MDQGPVAQGIATGPKVFGPEAMDEFFEEQAARQDDVQALFFHAGNFEETSPVESRHAEIEFAKEFGIEAVALIIGDA